MTTSPRARTSRCSSDATSRPRASCSTVSWACCGASSRSTCQPSARSQGLCLAAGLELALACDLIWASDDCNLGLVEAVIGATPFGGGTQRLTARAGAGRALEAVLTGRPYPAATMLEWGVVNRVLPDAELESKTRAFAERLAAGPTVAHAATKRMVHTAVNDGVEAADAALPAEGAARDGKRGPAGGRAHAAGRRAGKGEVSQGASRLSSRAAARSPSAAPRRCPRRW